MEKIKGVYGVADKIYALADEMEVKVHQYGWEDRTVMPWAGCSLKVTDIIRDMRDYWRCTSGSKAYLVSLANGLVDILNAWEAHELEPKVTVRTKGGKVRRISAEMAQEFIAVGLAEMVDAEVAHEVAHGI